MTRFMIRASTCGMCGGGDNDQTGPHEDVETLIVTADYSPPPENSIYINSIIEWQWLLDALYAGNGNPGIGGGGGLGGEEDPCDVAAENGSQNNPEDAAALSAASDILSQPDANEREYAYFLYQHVDGNIYRSEIIEGYTPTEKLIAGSSSSFPPGALNEVAEHLTSVFGASRIVGIIHNHPPDAILPGEEERSIAPGQEDWSIYNQGPPGFNPTTYIIGADGSIHRYENNGSAVPPQPGEGEQIGSSNCDQS